MSDTMSTTVDSAPDIAAISPNLRDALVGLVEELGVATVEFAFASNTLSYAEYAATEADHMLRITEIDARAKMLAAGVAGKNETERTAALALAMQNDPDVTHCRIKALNLTDKRRTAEAAFRAIDQRQKALRIRIAALTALIGGE